MQGVAELRGLRRAGAARFNERRQSLFGTAGLGCTRSRLTVGVQDVVAGVGQCPDSASASRTAAQELRGCKAENSQSSKIDERQVAGRHNGLEDDKDVRSGVVSCCVGVGVCGARRCGTARAWKGRSSKIQRASPSLFGTAGLGCTRTCTRTPQRD